MVVHMHSWHSWLACGQRRRAARGAGFKQGAGVKGLRTTQHDLREMTKADGPRRCYQEGAQSGHGKVACAAVKSAKDGGQSFHLPI